MRTKSIFIAALAMIVSGIPMGATAGTDVSIGINVGIPAPPPAVIVATPPPVVVVPGTPVYYVPSVGFNLFVFSGRYYSLHNGVWFQATGHNGPWTVIAAQHVPAPVLAVPATYYKIPPGQAKKKGGAAGGSAGCPPGLAKQGRC